MPDDRREAELVERAFEPAGTVSGTELSEAEENSDDLKRLWDAESERSWRPAHELIARRSWVRIPPPIRHSRRLGLSRESGGPRMLAMAGPRNWPPLIHSGGSGQAASP